MDVISFIETSGKTGDLNTEYSKDVISYGKEDFPVKEKAEFALNVKNIDGRELSLKGQCRIVVNASCDRCLKDVPLTFDVKIDRTFQIEDKQIVPDEDGETEKYFAEGELDTDSLIEEEIFLNWPAKVICKEDCKGLCPKCGKDLNDGECGCDRNVLDPRMAQFEDLFKNFKEV
ncbi:MAG: DUF177 domain-containing protein [Lachnospiraceae bacterium]|nr:DUF177 domain-containing protein [Lachnospiraceae bacterium]